MPRPRLMDTPSQGTYGEEGYVASKKGLFSALGNILTKTAIGLQDPSALGQLQQRELESQMEFEKYRQNRIQYNQEQKAKDAQQALDNFYKERGLGITPDPSGSIQSPSGITYKQDPMIDMKPLYSVGADNKPILIGNVPKGSQVVPNPNAQTADMKNASIQINQSKSLIKDLRGQAENLKGGYTGMGENIKATINRGAGDSANYKLYNDSLPATSVSFYRAVTGDTRLSDSDAKTRAYPLMWKTNESDDLKSKKFDFMERLITARDQLLNSGKYPTGVIPMEALKKQAKDLEGTKAFNVNGKNYNIPLDQVEDFKKEMGVE